MRRIWAAMLLAAALGALPFAAVGQTPPPMTEEPTLLPPSPMKAALWTNKLGYANGEQMSVYVTLDAMGDDTRYTIFLYQENVETGARIYLSPFATTPGVSPTAQDVFGLAPELAGTAALPLSTLVAASAAANTPLTKRLIWFGNVPSPGLWHIVGELRSTDTTQVVKRAYAKFVVTQNTPVVLGGNGRDTEIATDTTWSNDTIYKIQHQVFVNSGATLTIEPGTLILARGQNAVIVVEKGGRIMAEGTRAAPIVMTCDDAIGERASGCWGGLILLGDAPMTRGTGLAEGVIPETRPTYGGDDPMDSSGALRYVRVEFAGVDFNPETQPNAFGFHGVGSGTVIDHIQAHEAEDDGIEFFGGTADCMYCVSSGAKDDSLDWAFGWQGMGQYIFIQQDPNGDNGIEADNDSSGFDRMPRSHPKLYNLTMIGGLAQDPLSTSGDGMRIRVGTQVTARNAIVTGFGGDALDVRDNSPGFFTTGASTIQNSIITMNGDQMGDAQINGVAASSVGFMDTDPMLVNVRYEANPDPRPMIGSPALKVGAAATPPSGFDSGAQCIGAFCNGDNWLEEWTFFGDEEDYDVSQ